jgi:hypothetical protein
MHLPLLPTSLRDPVPTTFSPVVQHFGFLCELL